MKYRDEIEPAFAISHSANGREQKNVVGKLNCPPLATKNNSLWEKVRGHRRRVKLHV